jgi:hypothetical protein
MPEEMAEYPVESIEGNSVGVGNVSATRIDIYPVERSSIILGLG